MLVKIPKRNAMLKTMVAKKKKKEKKLKEISGIWNIYINTALDSGSKTITP